MRRNVRTQQYTDNVDCEPSNAVYQPSLIDESVELLQMDHLPHSNTRSHRFENTIEAKVEVGDTLQALALRFHCTVGDIKRLNKIDKENEIHARKVIKIPVTVHSVLLGGTLPAVHRSGNNSPKSNPENGVHTGNSIVKNPLEDARVMLSEKLMVASVNASGLISAETEVNDIVFNSKLAPSRNSNNLVYTDEATLSTADSPDDANSPLLNGALDDEIMTHLRPIRGPSMRTIDWSGSDCDMSWICLFVLILALCFVIPLVYVIYLAEHPHHHNQTSN